MSDNTVTLIGNVTRDPEIRFTTGGRAVASFGLACNRRWQSNGEWQEQVSFFDVVCWGTLGENAAASLDKGTRVVVFGRLEQRSWETDSGEKRSKIEVIADEVGPSLRWAKAEIERNERTKAGDGYEQTAKQHTGQGGGGYANPAYAGEEEPFVVEVMLDHEVSSNHALASYNRRSPIPQRP